MSKVDIDQGLLSGLLALQLGLITRETAAEAIRAWSVSRETLSLGPLLVERGLIDSEHLVLIETLVMDLGDKEFSPFVASIPTTLARILEASTPSDDLASDPFATRMPTTQEVGPIPTRFRRLRTHAEGGLGIVYVAHDGELNRNVALKEIKERSADDPYSRARFLLEAEVTGGLEHPGIVPVYAMGRYSDGRPYYAMRFVRGMTLQESIDRFHAANRVGSSESDRTLAFHKLLRTFLDVCNTIGYAHSRGVVHRDIKPSNILLGKFGETLVVDWGLAKAMDRPDSLKQGDELPLALTSSGDPGGTLAGSSVGTPGYMSPEQATGRLDLVGPTSDLFSLGATLYTILTGRPPFDGVDLWAILAKMDRGEFTHPRQHDPSISRGLEAICLKALATHTKDRYQSAAEFSEEIEHWLGDEPVAALPESRGRRMMRWGRKHRTAVRAMMLGLLLVTTFSVIATAVVEGARKSEKAERLRYQALLTSVALDHALSRLERGEASRGMLRLTQSFAICPVRETDLRRAIRANLGGWGRQLIPLKQTIAHAGMVHMLAFNPDGRQIITGSTINGAKSVVGETQLWDIQDGSRVGPPIRHRGTLLAVYFGPQRIRVLTGGSDTAARHWDGLTGHMLGDPFSHPDEIMAAAFRPDGQRFAVAGTTGEVQVWDVRANQPIGPRLQHPRAVVDVVFSPDGSRLLTGCADGFARVWDAGTGRMIGEPLPHNGAVRKVAFRPDGLRFATAGAGGLLRFWDAKSLRALEINLAHPSVVHSFAYSADGTRVVTGGEDNRARLWDAETGEPLGQPLEHRGSVEAVSLSNDGRLILTGGGDRTARVWDVGSMRFAPPITTRPDQVTAVAYLANGTEALIAGADGKVARADLNLPSTTTDVWDAKNPIRALAIRPDGLAMMVLTMSGQAQRIDLSSTRSQPTEPSWVLSPTVRAVAYRPDGQVIMTGGDDGVARFWDDSTGKPLALTLNHPGPIVVVAFHPTRPVALTTSGGVTRLWNLETGQPLLSLPTADGPIYSAAFAPDGKSLTTGGEDNTARVWNSETGASIGLPLEHRGSVLALAYSPDSQTLITGSNDGAAMIWDVITSKPLGPPLTHKAHVSTVAFAPSGDSVLTGSHDRTVRRRPVLVSVPDDLDFVDLWVRVTTGMALDTDYHRYGVARVIEDETWRRDRRALDARGGPPKLGLQ